MDICEYCITLLEKNIKLKPLLIDYYQLVIQLLVDLCKCHHTIWDKQKFVIKSEVQRKELFRKYDLYSQSLLEIKPDCEIPKINRSNGYCYIATAVYGSYNAPQVLVLRNFRDNNLSKNIFGRLFVFVYYKISPWFAKKLVGNWRINQIVRSLLDVIIAKISKNPNDVD